MWNRFYFKPFEAFVGIFVIVNGFLTLCPVTAGGSTVKDNLWNIMGYTGISVPIFQIVAGCMKLGGIALNKANIEAAGLIMVASMFMIRMIGLVADGEINNSDINNLVIAIGIIVSNLIKLTQIANGHRYVVTRAELCLRESK